MGVWDFIQDQVLGMKWLNELLGIGLSALGLDVNGRIGGSVQFFIYDVLKITVLLCVLIFAISYIQSYFPPERGKRILGRFHGIWANIISALLGTVTPFCSCSSIPLFIGFTSAGLPLGVTFSFLISSPMVDLGSLVLLMSIFGAKVAIVYVILGLVIAVIGGTMIEKLHMEKYVESFVLSAGSVDIESPDLTIRERLTYAKEQMLGTFKKVFPYILIGVGIGALIHNWIPESWIETVLGSNNPFGVILATPADEQADPGSVNARLPVGHWNFPLWFSQPSFLRSPRYSLVLWLQYPSGQPYLPFSPIPSYPPWPILRTRSAAPLQQRKAG